MGIFHTIDAAEFGGSLLRPLHSLAPIDLRHLEKELATLPGQWEIYAQEDYDGDLTLMLLPGAVTEISPAMALHGTADGIAVAVVRGEDYQLIQLAATMEAAMVVLHEVCQACEDAAPL